MPIRLAWHFLLGHRTTTLKSIDHPPGWLADPSKYLHCPWCSNIGITRLVLWNIDHDPRHGRGLRCSDVLNTTAKVHLIADDPRNHHGLQTLEFHLWRSSRRNPNYQIAPIG